RGAESGWVQPGNVISSGAFRLKQWRRYDRIVLERNPLYYDADRVSLEEVHVLSVAEASTIIELYESGEVHTMPGERIPSQFVSALHGKRDFCVAPAVFSVY